jgi:hypothetical protein
LPAFERLASFLRDFDALASSQKAAFLRAVVLFVADLRAGSGFRKSLRVKKMAGYDNIWELTWAPDGRATTLGAGSPLGRNRVARRISVLGLSS